MEDTYRIYEEHPNGVKLHILTLKTEEEANRAYDALWATTRPEVNYVMFKSRFARTGIWRWQ
jgi:hypothetical protein